MATSTNFFPAIAHKISATYSEPGAMPADPPVTYPISAVLAGSFNLLDIDGERIRQTDKRLLVRQDLVPVVPKRRALIELQGKRFEILGVRQGYYQDVWELHGREV
jgi:hypothetical protein